jgi:hypothetical protein
MKSLGKLISKFINYIHSSQGRQWSELAQDYVQSRTSTSEVLNYYQGVGQLVIKLYVSSDRNESNTAKSDYSKVYPVLDKLFPSGRIYCFTPIAKSIFSFYGKSCSIYFIQDVYKFSILSKSVSQTFSSLFNKDESSLLRFNY